VSKTLPVFRAGTADLILDVLNVLKDTAEEALVSNNRFAATFGASRLFIDPRRAMLGVRLTSDDNSKTYTVQEIDSSAGHLKRPPPARFQ
jgi:hypothetical protein